MVCAATTVTIMSAANRGNGGGRQQWQMKRQRKGRQPKSGSNSSGNSASGNRDGGSRGSGSGNGDGGNGGDNTATIVALTAVPTAAEAAVDVQSSSFVLLFA